VNELLGYVAVIVILALGIFSIKACNDSDHQNGIGFTTICLGGHEFYSKSDTMSYRGFLANKLDDDGKPVKCRRL